MKPSLVLVAIGVIIAAAGLWVTTANPIQINEGNQCGANGCRNVSTSVPMVAPGMFILIVGILVAVYGARRGDGDEG